MPTHILVVYNGQAASQIRTKEWMGKIVEELNKHSECVVSFFATKLRRDHNELTDLLKQPLDFVIAAGGDGTIRFVVAACLASTLFACRDSLNFPLDIPVISAQYIQRQETHT